jgi:hypothetical protein
MPGEIETAVDECIKARAQAAAPLTFNAEALKFANERTLAQFTANLALAGGWRAAGPALLKAATLFGATAKAIALFHNSRATEIDIDAAAGARKTVEEECKFGLAKRTGKHPTAIKSSDGLVCG